MDAKKTILHIDDEDDIREIVEFALEDDFEIFSFASAKEALEQAHSIKADILLLDVMMPEMDGPQAMTELKKIDHLKDLPVIFMTAKVNTSEINEFIELGGDGVIRKPFNPLSLPEEIFSYLEA